MLQKFSKNKLIFLSTLIGYCCLGDLFAVPPPPGFSTPDRPACKVNSVAMQSRSQAIKAAPAPFFKLPLIATTAYVAVVRVQFSDLTMTKTKAQTEAFMEQVKSFYLENSYGLLTVSATVTNSVYTLPQTLVTYGQGICSVYSQLTHDSVNAANPDINFSSFSHIMIYHAGVGAETANDSGCTTDNIWSVFAPTVSAGLTSGVTVPFSLDGKAFGGVTIVPESELQGIDPLGVICHEYGHQLGLPDLYNTCPDPPACSQQATTVGKWSLMDAGVYTGFPPGSNPSHLDAWSKQFLGFFSNPQTLTATEIETTVSLGLALSSSNAFLRIPIFGISGVDGTKEYFLVERRARSSLTGKIYDDALPFGSFSEGYLIWHIDDNIASNESILASNRVNTGSPNSPKFGVDLVEAAGTGGVPTATSGKDSDPFPGSTGKTLFATPLSDTFNGQQSGISLSGLSGSLLTLKKAFAASSLEVVKMINFPNPGGPSYQQKFGAPPNTYTTIVLNLSRPPTKIYLTIHDLLGSLIKEVPASEIKANGVATKTNKFVFEYDWDGKNSAGETVAAGVYLYRFKIDDSVVKTGKMVIVR